MTTLSFDRLLKSSRLAMPAIGRTDAFSADHSIRMTRPDRERLEGKVKKSRGQGGGGPGKAGKFASELSKRLKTKPPRKLKSGGKVVFVGDPESFDRRQRAVVKIHYFNHASGGGAGLRAHAKYVARDAATRDDLAVAANEPEQSAERHDERKQARAHAAYLDRSGASVFYDAQKEGVDGAARAETWAKSDLRHFRLILSAEEGARFRDLPSYTRQVMARAGAALGTTLSWIAVDHHDTDNPHTHIIVRGRRANGQDLVLPRDFIKHGLRSIARDVATEWIGRRTPDDERRALERDVRRHAPTRLDKMIEGQVQDGGRVRVAEFEAPNGDATLTQALKARMRELERLGLARRVDNGLFQMESGWGEKLEAMELHIDIRKSLLRARSQDLARAAEHQPTRALKPGLDR